MLTLTLCHMPIMGVEKMIDHLACFLEILHPPGQHFIPHGGQMVDPAGWPLCLFFFPRREYPTPLFHVPQGAVDGAAVDVGQTVLVQPLDEGVAVGRTVVQEQQ